jgi:hypothetical protein
MSVEGRLLGSGGSFGQFFDEVRLALTGLREECVK